MESITKYIEKKLGLKVNIEKSKVARPNQIKYLGFGFYYTKTGIIKPKPHLKSIQKFKRRLKQLNYVIRGWINYFKIGNMKMCLNDITKHLNRRIRCIIWKQWKTSRRRIESLIKLGCDKEQAKAIAYSRKSYWNSSLYVSIFITNKTLKLKVHTEI